MWRVVAAIAALTGVASAARAGGVAAADARDPSAAASLIGRVLGSSAVSHFDLHLTVSVNDSCGEGSSAAAAPCFALEDTPQGTLRVTATSMSELTYGIGYYLRFHCGVTVGWPRGGGGRTVAPAVWPAVGTGGVTLHRAVPLSWEDNVCTHSYSYAWYDAEAWRQHVDWMALAGINRFYAVTGQEEIQYKAFRKFNLTDLQIRSFFNGPAFLTWSRGQSMQSVGSPLPRSWMQAQWSLQKEILAMARPLGIVGVLPAFQGNMPPEIKWSYPNANISVGNWDGKADDADGVCAWVAGTDPLFGQVADEWMQIMIADWGTDHWYQCDGFFTGLAPPWYDTAPPKPQTQRMLEAMEDPVQPDPEWAKVWKGAWGGMARTDPQAVWLYQGWAIRGWNDAAGMSRLRALYDTVPHGQWVPLDMDISGIWRYSNNYSFFGAPFIWTTLHNMGGNDGLKGDMRMLQHMPSDALAAGASIIGTGATPEGIDQNPPYYEYAYDTAWHAEPQPLEQWFAEYPVRRYGFLGGCEGKAGCDEATTAWGILLDQVYHSEAGGWHDNTGVEWGWGLTASWVYGSDAPAGSLKTMNMSAMAQAWSLLVSTAAALEKSGPIPETLNYDVVNVGREVLAQLSSAAVLNVTRAVGDNDMAAATKAGGVLIELLDDLDTLLGCDTAFLLGPWIADARAWANASDAPAEYYEWQARSQVSTWWPVPESATKDPATFTSMPRLDTYANKHWNGLVKDFYTPRHQCYLDQLHAASGSGSTGAVAIDQKNLTKCVVTAELAFTLDTAKVYPTKPSGDTVAVSTRLAAKYTGFIVPPPPPPVCDAAHAHAGVKLSNTDYADGNGPRTTAGPSECCELCASTANCQHWSFNIDPSIPGKVCHWATLTYCCWLHATDKGPVAAAGWTSDVGVSPTAMQ